MTVKVEFCTGCGYYQKFADLSAELTKAFPGTEVVGNHVPPRMKTFEVVLDDKLIFSKLESDRFPEEGEIIKLIETEHERRVFYQRLITFSSVGVGVLAALAVICMKFRGSS